MYSKDIYSVLQNLHIPYEKFKHPAVFTCEEADKYCIGRGGAHTKNLFLRNKKGDQHYLVVLERNKQANLKKLAEQISTSNLSFASPERLLKYLEVTPGSVTPFGLINDVEKHVLVFIDEDLLKFAKVGFHPNVNTATLELTVEDFKRFLEWTRNQVEWARL